MVGVKTKIFRLKESIDAGSTHPRLLMHTKSFPSCLWCGISFTMETNYPILQKMLNKHYVDVMRRKGLERMCIWL